MYVLFSGYVVRLGVSCGYLVSAWFLMSVSSSCGFGVAFSSNCGFVIFVSPYCCFLVAMSSASVCGFVSLLIIALSSHCVSVSVLSICLLVSEKSCW